jgi:putative ATP-dependent endonuclease of the OLD family
MSIERVIVKNYRKLASADIRFRPDFNIIVGDNESGKSTLLEAINLALKNQINRRPAAYELHPYLFNARCIAQYVENLRKVGIPDDRDHPFRAIVIAIPV